MKRRKWIENGEAFISLASASGGEMRLREDDNWSNWSNWSIRTTMRVVVIDRGLGPFCRIVRMKLPRCFLVLLFISSPGNHGLCGFNMCSDDRKPDDENETKGDGKDGVADQLQLLARRTLASANQWMSPCSKVLPPRTTDGGHIIPRKILFSHAANQNWFGSARLAACSFC
jgi:hypothetical protein